MERGERVTCRRRAVCRVLCVPWVQVTLEPQMQGVFEELLSQAGAEIYTRPPERFGLPIGKELAWSEVTEVVRAQNELAVGLVSLSTDGAAHLGLPLSTKVVLRPRDRLVVLADE